MVSSNYIRTLAEIVGEGNIENGFDILRYRAEGVIEMSFSNEAQRVLDAILEAEAQFLDDRDEIKNSK